MNIRDRSSEFKHAIVAASTVFSPCVIKRKLKKFSHLSSLADSINSNSVKLQEKVQYIILSIESKSIFEGHDEIQRFIVVIKSDLSVLDNDIKNLKDIVNNNFRNKTSQLDQHWQCVVFFLQSRLRQLSNAFKIALENHSLKLRKKQAHKKEFVSGDCVLSLPQAIHSNYHTSVLIEDEIKDIRSKNKESDIMYQYEQLYDKETDSVHAETSELQNIESTIVELGSMFQNIAIAVREQEEAIQRIDHNVEMTQLSVEAAHTELIHAFHNVSNNTRFILKVLTVLIAFFIIFMIFIV